MENSLSITFGDRVAENESNDLSNYFIKTEHWDKVRSGNADIVFGSKGAGKSALYTLLFKQSQDLQKEGVTLISAEKPTGQTVFSDIKNTPPTTEVEFISLWKIYLCQLIVQKLIETKNCTDEAIDVKNKLVEAGLIQEENTLKRLVNSAMAFARRLVTIDSIEAGASLDGGLNGKITFGTPTPEN